MLLMRCIHHRGGRGAGPQEKAISKVVKQLKKRSGAISVLAEFSRDERLVHHDLSDLSRACRSLESSHVTRKRLLACDSSGSGSATVVHFMCFGCEGKWEQEA